MLVIRTPGEEVLQLDLRTHMAIEFTKAIVATGASIKPNTSNEIICLAGITLADELIKQLNKTKTQ